jgi:hypothetical protein
MSEVDLNSCDPVTLHRLADAGDPDAQRVLAIRLYTGDGVAMDQSRAAGWLQRAAEHGDSWAQTQHAINLRRTGNQDNERESVEWLKRAVEQGDHWAQFTLGLQQYQGIGTPVDVEAALVNITQAALGGFQDAAELLPKLLVLPNIDRDAIFERVRWASLTFIMGPLLDGHLTGLTADEALWFQYETDTANLVFVNGSALGTAFDCGPISVKQVYVGRAIVESQTLAAVTISMRDIIDSSGNPVCVKPADNALDAVTSVIGLMCARKWVRCSYASY